MKIFRQRFQNRYPHPQHSLLGVLRWKLGLAGREPSPPWAAGQAAENPGQEAPQDFSAAPEKDRIRLTWIGHSTFLVQHQGRNLLTDPIFGNCQPFPAAALRRAGPPGMEFARLPPIHDVLISHSHYDHLDAPTIRSLGGEVRYWAPSGLSRWFQRRGIQSCRELAWGESAALSDALTIHSVPAQHASGRTPFDRNRTHWCGWVLKSAARSIYFAGDTGYCPLFKEIGARFGGFDLAMIPIGAYNPRWLMSPVHLNPAEAVEAHIDTASRLSVACHWGTFRLTDEPLDEPPRLLALEMRARGLDPQTFRVLRPGQTIEI